MKNRWDEKEAAQCKDDLDLRVYSSRLLGQDKSLVLHGGGNTSVKIRQKSIIGQEQELLLIKGSGWDLEFIERQGFSPVCLDHLCKLARLTELSDLQMVNELKTHMTLASAPTPSVETILHSLLPYKYVDHTHADAIVTITNTDRGRERIRTIYGQRVVIIPYVMPGFDLAKKCAEEFPRQVNEHTVGMVLMNHGLFTFGEHAKESYDRMIQLVDEAESYLQSQQVWELNLSDDSFSPAPMPLATLRSAVSAVAGIPLVMQTNCDSLSATFLNRNDLSVISQQGPATPDHVIRTKRIPMLGTIPAQYVDDYRAYFKNCSSGRALTMLDPAPRIVLDKNLGVCCFGKSVTEANIVADLYRHTMKIIIRSSELGGYKALSEQDLFDVEYWELEQAKLNKGKHPPMFGGEIVLISGTASGIGKACVESFLRRGACVIALDKDPRIEGMFTSPQYFPLLCDLNDEVQIKNSIEQGVVNFGGLDMLVLNAGVFPASQNVADLPTLDWRQVITINLDANLVLLREAHPYLAMAPKNGRVVVIGSKNVVAPGPGAAAYSASKAALNQLARVIALEWGNDKIRINSLHPNAVFDTGIWTPEVLQTRARSYGLSIDEYKTKNVLGTEVTSYDVAELAAEMCGPLFAKTTGAQVPVDGGNERVI